MSSEARGNARSQRVISQPAQQGISEHEVSEFLV